METVKKYRVIALSVGADSNKIFKSGDIVQSDAWEDPKMAEKLVEQGFLEPYDGKEEVTSGVDLQPPVKDPDITDQATNEKELGLKETAPETEAAKGKANTKK